MDAFVDGFGVVTQPGNLLYCLVGVLIGMLIGVLPGLGPAATMAITVPAVGPPISSSSHGEGATLTRLWPSGVRRMPWPWGAASRNARSPPDNPYRSRASSAPLPAACLKSSTVSADCKARSPSGVEV